MEAINAQDQDFELLDFEEMKRGMGAQEGIGESNRMVEGVPSNKRPREKEASESLETGNHFKAIKQTPEERRAYRKEWMRGWRRKERSQDESLPEVQKRKEKARASKTVFNRRYYLKRKSRQLLLSNRDVSYVDYANMTEKGLYYRGVLVPKDSLDSIVAQIEANSSQGLERQSVPSCVMLGAGMQQPAQVEVDSPACSLEGVLQDHSLGTALVNPAERLLESAPTGYDVVEVQPQIRMPSPPRASSPLSQSLLTSPMEFRNVRSSIKELDWRASLPLRFSLASNVDTASPRFCDVDSIYPDKYLAVADASQLNSAHTVMGVMGNGNCLPASIAEGINWFNRDTELTHRVVRAE
jgi:hypothetical protein